MLGLQNLSLVTKYKIHVENFNNNKILAHFCPSLWHKIYVHKIILRQYVRSFPSHTLFHWNERNSSIEPQYGQYIRRNLCLVFEVKIYVTKLVTQAIYSWKYFSRYNVQNSCIEPQYWQNIRALLYVNMT